MAEEQKEHTEVEADIKQGKFKIRGSDWLGVLTFTGVAVFGYILFDHNGRAAEAQSAFVGAVKEMTIAQRDSVQAQRVMNCLLATPQDRREAAITTCERIAR